VTGAKRSRSPRTFVFRKGTRIAGTVIACDGAAGGDLLFVSNASGYGSAARDGGRAPRAHRGRGQVLVTTETLALLGDEGERLRGRSLVVGYGRPFALGPLRLELLPTGFLPGAAALACDSDGRRVLYAGTARLGAAGIGAAPGVARTADALCLDATFGHPRFDFVAEDEARARAVRFASDARDAACAPVILAAPLGPAQDLAAALAGAGFGLRGHRAVVAAAAAYRRAGVSVPPVSRLAGPLRRNEVLLWPAAARGAGQLGQLGPARTAWFSGWAADREAAARLGADIAVPYSNHADFAGLVRYVLATGAREVALLHGHAEELAAALRDRDLDAYVPGPPRQIAFGWGDGPAP
jgi:putative mRNA 3-end processing factor